MCPKTKADEATEPVDAEDEERTRAAQATGKRSITRSGAFPKTPVPTKDRPKRAEPPPSSRSAKEEVVLIGVTSKASRYVFVAPRPGKKKPSGA